MKGGAWHVYQTTGGRYSDAARYEAVWVADEADPNCTYEQYLDGMYLHRHDAEHLADAANLLVGDDPDGTRVAALRAIVEALR